MKIITTDNSGGNLKLGSEYIAVKCVGDGQTDLIEKAVLAGWKQCKECGYVICRSCISEFTQFAKEQSKKISCPGSFLRTKQHVMDLVPIPVEDFIVMAEKHLGPTPPATGILIHRAFFSQKTVLDEENEGVKSYINPNPLLSSFFIAKQEHWASMGTVIVKRDRGKFITWERLTEF
ncbi:MAG: hypothetical protein ACXAC7_06750 [Candidatus Hodarchaeales archaeon]